MKKKLQTALIIFMFLFTAKFTSAQWVTIPDPYFVNWLNANGFSSCMNGNLMDTTCSAIVNATYIQCEDSSINSLDGIQYFDNLISITLGQTDSYLNAMALNIIPAFPPSLENIQIHAASLTSLPPLPDSLIALEIHVNNLTSLPALPNTLHYLLSENTYLNSLPALPDSLETLFCRSNQLTSLPTLNNSLKVLVCSGNNLSTLPQLPNSLRLLGCNSNNNIVTLPALPDSLTTLSCGGYYFTSLPFLPNTLKFLSVSNSPNFTFMPNMPDSLNSLNIYETSMATLPPLHNMKSLNCWNNLLTTVILPEKISIVDLVGNKLQSISALPDSMYSFSIDDNPTLQCLPKLNYISDYFSFSNTGLTCLPNYPSGSFTSNPPIASLPLCDLFNVNGCPAYWNISGKVYADSNNNCIAEGLEKGMGNVKVMLDSAGTLIQQRISNNEGFYSFDTDTGFYTYTIDTTNLPVLLMCPAIGYHTSTLTALDSMNYNKNFGMQCKPGFDVGVKSIARDSGFFIPANYTRIKIIAGDMSNLFGLHCATGIGGYVKVKLTGLISYIAPEPGALVPIISGDTLIYNIADFGSINAFDAFRFIVQTDTTATLFSQACFEVTVSPDTGDFNPNNNSLNHCFTISTSYDPNNKEASPTAILDSTLQWLTYTINFQNTGTATAQHIYLLDTLDDNIDAASFELIAYSHQPVTQVIGTVVRFNFPGINLPDSLTNEPGSHGYVQYKVKLKSGLALGTSIYNTANIYFDFNAPVVTNTTTNTIVDCNLTPLATIIFNNLSFCLGDTVVANAIPLYPVLTSWQIDGKFAGNGFTISTDTISAGTHVISLTASNNVCSQSLTQNIFVDAPVKPTFSANGNQLTSNSASNNQWYLNGVAIAGANQSTYTIQYSGSYMVAVTDSFGCTAFSDSMWVSMVGIEEIKREDILVYPNPFADEISVNTNKNAEVKVYDQTGRIIFNHNNFSGNLKINTASWSKGIYNLQLIFKDTITEQKMVKK